MAIADAVIRHQIDLVQYSNGVVRRIIALLNRVDPDMAARLAAALETLPPESFTVERLEAVLASVRALNRQAYAQAAGALEQELRDFAAVEVEWQQAFFRRQIASTFVSVTAEQVYSAAMSRPFAGRLLREWSQGIEANRMTRIRDAVRIGYVSNESIPQIVRRIRGTRARQYKDGLLEIDRRHAESVVRTAISHTAGVTRDRFVEANLDIVEAVVWTSTLDGRTSQPCRIRDGKRYRADNHKPIGHKFPWGEGPGKFHWNCRSTAIPLLKGQDELFGTRASADGQVDANLSYGAWLRRQSAETQDEVLGPTRGRLLREGKLPMDAFYNDKGRYLTLDELRARNAAAFARAGL